MAQRRFGLTLRTNRRGQRSHSRIYELASARTPSCDQSEHGPIVQTPHLARCAAVLRRRQRHTLQPGALSMLLSAATGTIDKLLPRVPRSSERRPNRLPDLAEDPRQRRYERFPTEVGEIRARFDSRVRGLGDAIRWVRSIG